MFSYGYRVSGAGHFIPAKFVVHERAVVILAHQVACFELHVVDRHHHGQGSGRLIRQLTASSISVKYRSFFLNNGANVTSTLLPWTYP